ncbi:glucose-1-phosphate adenylyltransferase [mine drainage metagenome]|uniref:Glucose-1-phosphate adenylyltransferase n=1 Tax=mine drainage metagenome TaxID=410659 RepID=A0A1J5QJ60_9ZZZZ
MPPAKFIDNEEGRRGSAVSSLVSGDCIVSGSEVSNSLLFTGCRTHSFASLEYVVALPGVVVNRKAELKNCVIDRGVIIPEGLVVGADPVEDERWFRRTESGIVLVTQPMLDVRAAKLG